MRLSSLGVGEQVRAVRQRGLAMHLPTVAALRGERQRIRGIEFLFAPGAGEVWLGCGEGTFLDLMPALIRRLALAHPKIVVHAAEVNVSEGHGTQHRRERRSDPASYPRAPVRR